MRLLPTTFGNYTQNPTTYSRTIATAGAVYLPKANTEGGAAGTIGAEP